MARRQPGSGRNGHGRLLYHQKPRTAHPAARDPEIQDQLLSYCATLTGVTL